MNRIIQYTFFLTTLILFASCAARRPDTTTKVEVRLPVQPEQQIKAKEDDGLPSVVEMKDRHGNKTIYAQTEKNEEGKAQLSVQLSEVTITAKLKSIPERSGKIDVDFIVHVPENLIDQDWQVNLTPHLLKNESESDFDDLVLTGQAFDKIRQEGYNKYHRYLGRIVPDSLFNKHFVKTGAYNRYLSDYQKVEQNRIYKDSMEHIGYQRYKGKLKARYLIFNNKVQSSRIWLKKIHSYPKVKQRYEYFNQDTSRIARIYSASYNRISSFFPQFYLLREVTDKTIKPKYRDAKFSRGFQSDYNPVTAADSAFILKRFLKNDKIEKNKKLVDNQDIAFRTFVKFPRNESARLDSVIHRRGKVEYYYHQQLMADEDSKRLHVYLDGTVLTSDGREYLLPSSDTITYTVSSMIHFLDMTPRYVRKIIERKATSSLRAYITFKAGKSDLDISLSDNREEIGKVQQMINELTGTGEYVMDSISIMAGCSPEGSFRSNMQLAKKRGESIRGFLMEKLSDIKVTEKMLPVYSKGEDWEGLTGLIHASDGIEGRQQILELIASVGDPDNRELAIKQRFAADYKFIRDELYPRLRAVDFTFHIHRKGMIKDTIHTTQPDTYYAKGIDLMVKRKYSDALQILNEYNDFNTAICLMSLGYDKAAYNILENQTESADTQYLLAVLASRLGNEQEAVSRYQDAVRMDATKRWRGTLDPEINKLIKAYGLNKEEDY